MSPSFKLYVVAPASVLPISDLGALFYTHGRTPLHGGRPAIFIFIFGPWPAGQGEWLADQVGWPAGHLPESSLAGQLSAFQPIPAVRIFLAKYPSIRGIFWEGMLGCNSLPFYTFSSLFEGLASSFARVAQFLLKNTSPKTSIFLFKNPKNFQAS